MSGFEVDFIMTRCIIPAVVIGIISYLIGSINSSIIISRIVMGKDIRESGSGNAGATNVLRTMGKKYAVITLIIDVLKGVIAVLIARLWVGKDFPDGYGVLSQTLGSDFLEYQKLILSVQLPYIAGVCVVLGHNFPIFFGFKGGKGVATSLGVVMMLDWKVGLVVLVTAIAIIAITRYVSLGSIVGAIAFAALEIIKMAYLHSWNTIQVVCVLILAGLIVIRHHENIGRLLNGTENKLGAKKGE